MENQVVQSPTGKNHRQRGGSFMIVCGLAFLDLFATYEYGTLWPRIPDGVVDCKRCSKKE